MFTERITKLETELRQSGLNLSAKPLMIVLPALLFLNAGWLQSRASAPLLDELVQLERACQIEVVTAGGSFSVHTTFGMIEGRNADETDIQGYSKLFASEFSLYPAELVHRSQLHRVVFCTGLSFAGQRRNAVPDFEHHTLYLDVSRGKNNPLYLRKVIHHEFFHIIDYRDDGNLYQDDAWSSLNAGDFRYGPGGAAVQNDRNTSILTSEFPGFLNHYSTTGVEEDKAEVFANLMVGLAVFEERASKDPVLNAKMEQMKALLNRFCPGMDESFWVEIRSVKRIE